MKPTAAHNPNAATPHPPVTPSPTAIDVDLVASASAAASSAGASFVSVHWMGVVSGVIDLIAAVDDALENKQRTACHGAVHHLNQTVQPLTMTSQQRVQLLVTMGQMVQQFLGTIPPVTAPQHSTPLHQALLLALPPILSAIYRGSLGLISELCDRIEAEKVAGEALEAGILVGEESTSDDGEESGFEPTPAEAQVLESLVLLLKVGMAAHDLDEAVARKSFQPHFATLAQFISRICDDSAADGAYLLVCPNALATLVATMKHPLLDAFLQDSVCATSVELIIRSIFGLYLGESPLGDDEEDEAVKQLLIRTMLTSQRFLFTICDASTRASRAQSSDWVGGGIALAQLANLSIRGVDGTISPQSQGAYARILELCTRVLCKATPQFASLPDTSLAIQSCIRTQQAILAEANLSPESILTEAMDEATQRFIKGDKDSIAHNFASATNK